MTRQKYDIKRLEDYCIKNAVELIGDYTTNMVTGKTKITGICTHEGCNEQFCKKFTQLIKTNAFCKYHTTFNATEKYKQTCLDRFGSKNVFQNVAIKEKSKQTLQLKYGVSHPMHSQQIKDKVVNTNLIVYGTKNPMQNEVVKEKTQQTCINRYGTRFASQNLQIKEKVKETCMRNYGVPFSMQSSIVREKSKITSLLRYGKDNPMKSDLIKDRVKNTFMTKYGVPHNFQNVNVINKFKSTMQQRYNVDNPSQYPAFKEKSHKSMIRTKDYTLPSGKIIQYQGYEHFAIEYLLQNGIDEENLVTGCEEVPQIWYEDHNQIQHRHFVDIFIPSQNKCIEVKSTWTITLNPKSIFLKQEAGKQLGYQYEIWVYNAKGERVETHT